MVRVLRASGVTIILTTHYIEEAEQMADRVGVINKGSLILVDNVVRDGAVVDAGSSDPSVQGVRHLNELLAVEPRVSATAIQTVGSKGYDGFLLALVLEE